MGAFFRIRSCGMLNPRCAPRPRAILLLVACLVVALIFFSKTELIPGVSGPSFESDIHHERDPVVETFKKQPKAAWANLGYPSKHSADVQRSLPACKYAGFYPNPQESPLSGTSRCLPCPVGTFAWAGSTKCEPMLTCQDMDRVLVNRRDFTSKSSRGRMKRIVLYVYNCPYIHHHHWVTRMIVHVWPSREDSFLRKYLLH
jgi:hypothetical protein